MTETRTLHRPDAEIVYDVRGPLPAKDARPPLLMVGQPMQASGFNTLAGLMSDRTVVTYDPRGIGRSVRRDGRTDNSPAVQADDLHHLITDLQAGPVDCFASSGGAVTMLELVTKYPGDVSILVAHEPPLISVLPDATNARAAQDAFINTYRERGRHWGMAGFIAMTSWQGPFTDDFLERAPADPSSFGMPDADDGSRDDPLLSGASSAVTDYQPDVEALITSPARIVIAVGEESAGTFTGRSAPALAARLNQPVVTFPSHHGGFAGGEFGYAGQPEAFAERLGAVLAGTD